MYFIDGYGQGCAPCRRQSPAGPPGPRARPGPHVWEVAGTPTPELL